MKCQKYFYLESDEVWLEEGAWHALLGREEGDGGGALVDGLVRARDGDHREGVVLVHGRHGHHHRGHNLNIGSQLTTKYPNDAIYHLPDIFHSSVASESSVCVIRVIHQHEQRLLLRPRLLLLLGGGGVVRVGVALVLGRGPGHRGELLRRGGWVLRRGCGCGRARPAAPRSCRCRCSSGCGASHQSEFNDHLLSVRVTLLYREAVNGSVSGVDHSVLPPNLHTIMLFQTVSQS